MIKVDNLHKTFKLYHSPADRLKEIVTGRRYCHEFSALKGVSFTVDSGETMGIVGQNGAGKSTLLKLLTGILLPDEGTVEIDGKITGLLELGTGFNAEFTGMQNIFLNGTFLGMGRQEISDRLEAIVEFTELGDFIDQPIKTYSSGMLMRLAFSVAIHADPKVFVVDEALAVGDAYFQQKCMNRIKQFKEQGGSIVFVSHDMNAVKVLCNKAMLLDHGSVVEAGEPDDVIKTYNFLLSKRTSGEEFRFLGNKPSDKGPAKTLGYGDFRVEIAAMKLLDRYGHESEFFAAGDPCSIEVSLKANDDIDDLTVGILIRDRFGQDIFGTNTHHLKLPIELQNHQTCVVIYDIEELNLGPGKYTLTVAAHKSGAHTDGCYQWVDVITTFEVLGDADFYFTGLSRLKPNVHINIAADHSAARNPV